MTEGGCEWEDRVPSIIPSTSRHSPGHWNPDLERVYVSGSLKSDINIRNNSHKHTPMLIHTFQSSPMTLPLPSHSPACGKTSARGL